MNKPHLLRKLASVGVAVFGAIVVIGIATAPAQAGTLEWDGGTSSFFDDVNPENGVDGLGDDFSVRFSPDNLGGIASVFIASDEFAPPFSAIPPSRPDFFAILSPAQGTFEFTRFIDVNGNSTFERTEDEFIYTLQDDLTFQFDANQNGVYNPTEDVSVTIEGQTEFLGDFDVANGTVEGVDFEQDLVAGVTVNIAGNIYTIDDVIDGDIIRQVTGEEFAFGQAANTPEGGGYEGQVVVRESRESEPVPEPGTLLGLLGLGGLGLGLKRKKKLWKAS